MSFYARVFDMLQMEVGADGAGDDVAGRPGNHGAEVYSSHQWMNHSVPTVYHLLSSLFS